MPPDPVTSPTAEVPPFAPPATGGGVPEKESVRHRRLETLKDNVEAFTVALVMALVIKYYCVEAFKIPTGSMWPTLYGEDNSPERVGDRILVDKWAYFLSGPARWDVVVFRYPLNESKHFIKRVAGLGGEWIRIVRGDLWTRRSEEEPWRIATKRRHARDELYLPVYPPEPSEKGGTWNQMSDPSDYWQTGDGWSVHGYRELAFAGGSHSAAVFRKRIGESTTTRSYDILGDSSLVRDVRFRMTLHPEAAAVVVLRWKTSEDAVVELRLAPPGDETGSSVMTRQGGVEVTQVLPVRLVPERTMEVELECVDGQVYVRLDGREHAHLDERRQIDEVRPLEDYVQRFEIEAEGGAVVMGDIAVDRDVHYIPKSMPGLGPGDRGVRIPIDHYFMLGDNTVGSSDSRLWKLSSLTLKDGTEIRFESEARDNSPHREDDGFMHVVAQDGVERRWRPEDVVKRNPNRRQSFVDRDLIVGRAFLVFWPVLPRFPGRVGFIH